MSLLESLFALLGMGALISFVLLAELASISAHFSVLKPNQRTDRMEHRLRKHAELRCMVLTIIALVVMIELVLGAPLMLTRLTAVIATAPLAYSMFAIIANIWGRIADRHDWKEYERSSRF